MTIPEALEIKQGWKRSMNCSTGCRPARRLQIAWIDMDMLSEFAEPADLDREQPAAGDHDYLRDLAEQQGLSGRAIGTT
jgi:hypothetical protein